MRLSFLAQDSVFVVASVLKVDGDTVRLCDSSSVTYSPRVSGYGIHRLTARKKI